MDEGRARYLDIVQMVNRELWYAERVYVNGILQNGLESGNNKSFWKHVKSEYVKVPKFLQDLGSCRSNKSGGPTRVLSDLLKYVTFQK